MVELRWVKSLNERHILQYRHMIPTVDVSGAMCPGGWSAWKDIPTIDASGADYGDVDLTDTKGE